MRTNRNDPCPCKSGKKFKRCCINKPVNNVIPIRTPFANPPNIHNPNFNPAKGWMDGDWDDEDWDDEDWDDEDWMDDYWAEDEEEEYENDLLERLFESFLNGEGPDDELQEEIEHYTDENPDFMLGILEMMQQIRREFLRDHDHIKAYDKVRELHQEITDSMVIYYEKGKFEPKMEINIDSKEYSHIKELERIFSESSFDFRDYEQLESFMDIIIYKHMPQMSCITEEFIKQKRYKKPEKMEMLNSMLESRLGLYEIYGVDEENAYVDMRNVLTDEKVRIIDEGMSGLIEWEEFYFYTRIINFQGMAFNTGLNFIFEKDDPFIQKFIRKEKKEYNREKEFTRFMELHNQRSEGEAKGQR